MIMPYLTFGGDCEQALALYASAFGGKIESLSRYTMETGGPALDGKVMHAYVSFDSRGGLSAGDVDGAISPGSAMKLLVHCDTAQDAMRILDKLAVGGHIISRLTPHPPPDDDGMGALVCDQYGYTWILTAPVDSAK